MRAKTYESLGVRPAYLLAARIAGERPLPASGVAPAGLSAQDLEDALKASRYFESANIAWGLLYVPHVWFFWEAHRGALAYTLGLMGLHAACVVVERYKRALCREILARPEWLSQESRPKLPEFQGPRASDVFFNPKRFESERFFLMIGMGPFRKFVQWVVTTLTNGLKKGTVESLPAPTRANALEFERKTRVAEAVHWFGVALNLPLVALSWVSGSPGLTVWSAVITLGDSGLAVLQRWHRVRLWPVVSKIRAADDRRGQRSKSA
jgi:hypothetical protein